MNRPILAVLLLTLLSPAARADDSAKNTRTVFASGDAIIYVVPDEVVVSFGVETFDKDLDKAKDQNDSLSAALVKSIKAMGVEDKHLQAEDMNISIVPKDYQRPGLGVEGYYAKRTYAVTLKDTKKFSSLIDSAIKSGANRIYGYQFRTSELRKHRDQARKNAIIAAKEKATLMAATLDCKLGKPRMINEGASDNYGFTYNRANMSQNSFQTAEGFAGAADETMPLGQIAIRASVSVTFDLED